MRLGARTVQRVQRVAARLLTDRCAVTRWEGTGAAAAETTVATGLPCRHEPTRQSDLAALPGGLEAVQAETFYCAPTADVRDGDTLTPASGGAYVVRGVARGTDGPVLTVWTERRG